MLLHLISITPYTYYSFVEALPTLILLPLVEKSTIYGLIIIYQLWHHDENIKLRIKFKYKWCAKKKDIKGKSIMKDWNIYNLKMQYHTIHMTVVRNKNEDLIPNHSALDCITDYQGLYHIRWNILWGHWRTVTELSRDLKVQILGTLI